MNSSPKSPAWAGNQKCKGSLRSKTPSRGLQTYARTTSDAGASSGIPERRQIHSLPVISGQGAAGIQSRQPMALQKKNDRELAAKKLQSEKKRYAVMSHFWFFSSFGL